MFNREKSLNMHFWPKGDEDPRKTFPFVFLEHSSYAKNTTSVLCVCAAQLRRDCNARRTLSDGRYQKDGENFRPLSGYIFLRSGALISNKTFDHVVTVPPCTERKAQFSMEVLRYCPPFPSLPSPLLTAPPPAAAPLLALAELFGFQWFVVLCSSQWGRWLWSTRWQNNRK